MLTTDIQSTNGSSITYTKASLSSTVNTDNFLAVKQVTDKTPDISQTQTDNRPGYQWHLLLIDDDPSTRELCGTYLRLQGFRVWGVSNTTEARAALSHHLPDLVLLDLSLPDISGLEYIRYLRQQRMTTLLPIIIVSGAADSKDICQGLATGADDYITKPIDLNILKARINALLRRECRKRVMPLDTLPR
jgi:CheY-like chemotaxis protein